MASSSSSHSHPSFVRILDTTLRDGEQAPGAAMTAAQKLELARLLALLRVDVVEAGFPASSPDELRSVSDIARAVGTSGDGDRHVPVIGAVARCETRDVEAAWEAVRGASRPRVSVFVSTSEVHMRHKLRKGRDEVVAAARHAVAFARSLGCMDVAFAAEDAGRSDREFLYLVLEEVIKAGATTVVIPDTVGYNLPSEFGRLIAGIKANVRGIDGVIIAAHCHNDLGLATANTLAAAECGARQLEVTVNGIGERAGNASLEEVVMAIKCRKDLMGGLYTGIDTTHIVSASKMVMRFTGINLQPHKPIVGANAFSHESGIHQDGVLKFRGTYEIILPEDIGLSQSDGSNIVLGKLSGRHALRYRLSKLGYDINGKDLDDIFGRFKEVTKKKKHITDSDIEELIYNENFNSQAIWSLVDLQVIYGTPESSKTTVRLVNSVGKEEVASSVGESPVDAAYKAINSILKVRIKLVKYMNSAMEGINAIASTHVIICEDNACLPLLELNGESKHCTFSGNGTGKDNVVSSIQAYINALNKMLGFKYLPA